MLRCLKLAIFFPLKQNKKNVEGFHPKILKYKLKYKDATFTISCVITLENHLKLNLSTCCFHMNDAKMAKIKG